MKKYLDLFVSEAGEHIQAAGSEASRLSAGLTPPDILNSLFRHFHSIKGMAASMGFTPITTLSHAVEDLFDHLRKKDMEVPPGLSDLLMEVLDTTSAMVSQAAAGPDASIAIDPSPMAARIRALIPPPGAVAARVRGAGPPVQPAPGPAAAPPPSPASERQFRCLIGIDPAADFPGPRAALAVRRLERIGQIVGCEPHQDALLTTSFGGEIVVTLSTDRPEAAIRACLNDLLDLRRLEISEGGAPGAPGTAPPPLADTAAQATVRIQTSTLDWFLDSMSGMMARRGALAEALRCRQVDAATLALEKLSESIDGLRERVMELRLMPFEGISPRLTRTVREVARRTARRVSLQITGAEVSLDRSVLEEIIDPLDHLLRNAVDHGIELPTERELAGKPPAGTIRIDVSRSADMVQVVVEDDGRGMDLAAIRRKALSGGFFTQAELAAMDEPQILMLTTIPGFSTAAKITEVSGRGVGMDVVRTRIEAMRGHMSISSTRGTGTRISMSVPLTVAVIDAFLVECGAGLFAVPAGAVGSVELIDPVHLRSSLGGAFLPARRGPSDPDASELVPVVDLDEALGSAPRGASPPGASPVPVLAYQVNGTRGALAVGKIRGRGDLVVKPLGPPLERLRRYSGVALLDDGNLALILDLANLARSA
ncbi:MAG TPA: chemotaxis protein CheA [Candidatus Polarisedimenticolia bacterium]